MAEVAWLESLVAGVVCLGSGLFVIVRFRQSKAAVLFLLAMASAFVSLVTGPIFSLLPPAESGLAEVVAKVFVTSGLLASTFIWQTSLMFPIERRIALRPANLLGIVIPASALICLFAGSFAGVDYPAGGDPKVSDSGYLLLLGSIVIMIVVSFLAVFGTGIRTGGSAWRSGLMFMLAIAVFAAAGLPHVLNPSSLTQAVLVAGIAMASVVAAYSIVSGLSYMLTMSPVPEAFASASKSSYNLAHRHAYLVEETKPEFSFKVFTDVLKGRCFDCENDESFPCESLACSTCSLPCPCRDCTKYKSRSHGLVVTRQYPREVRTKFYLQTTPIVWLSTIAGKENLDPAKLSVLTDMLVKFMERSTNGVLMVDGLEYLTTSNDFPRVLKAIDRWTEVAMTSSSRLIITVDPRAFEPKEIALLERDKDVVRPGTGDFSRLTSAPT